MRIAIILPALVLAACGSPPPMPAPPPPAVGVAAPLVRELPVERVFTGRIEPTETVELSPQVSGRILRVLAADGAEVKAGDPLLEIDPEPFRVAVARAEAGVAQAEANLRLATDARDRNQRLLKDNVVAQQVYDDSVTTAIAADAGLAAARAALATARLDLQYTTLKAPIAGRIGRLSATVGNIVQGGGGFPPSVVGTLVAIDPVWASFDLDEVSYRRLAPRLAASAAGTAPVRVRAGLAGEEGFPHPGSITFVDNRVDSGSGSIRVRATLANAQRLLTPGAYARIVVEIEPPRQVLLVHEQSILAELATRYVLAVDSAGVTSFRPVQPGPAHGALREVTGLAPTDRIVATNLAKVFFPGMPVQPTPVDMETLLPPASPAAPEAAPGAAPAAPAAPAAGK